MVTGCDYMLIAGAFFLLLGYLVIIDSVSFYLLWVYGVVSLWTVLVYAWDKSAAKKGKWRVQEKTLHLLSLLCGWPGALIGQSQLRHKSSKWRFLWLFYVMVVLNVSVVVWFLHSETGALIQSWFHH